MACTYRVKHLFDLKKYRVYRCLNFVRCKSEGTKVVLLNSYSKVGILTAYLLKKTNLFSEICIHEPRYTASIEGIVADLNNIYTPSLATFQRGKTSAIEALKNANIVVMLEKSLQLQIELGNDGCQTPLQMAAEILNKAFKENAESCAKLAEAYARICPAAFLVVAMKPVNSTLPLVCKIAGRVNHNVNVQKILGFMSLDVVTANLLWAKNSKTKMESMKVPVVGGSSAHTTIPLFSQINQSDEADDNNEKMSTVLKKLTEDVRKMNEVLLLNPKAPLATAAAIATFVISLGTAIKGNELKEYAYVQSNILPNVTYLAGPVQLGPAGVQQVLPLPILSDYEKLLLDSIPYYLINDIKRGEDFADDYLKRMDCN